MSKQETLEAAKALLEAYIHLNDLLDKCIASCKENNKIAA